MDSCSCFMPVGKMASHHFSLAAAVAPVLRCRRRRFAPVLVAVAATNRFGSSISNPGNGRITAVDNDLPADRTRSGADVSDFQELRSEDGRISDEMRKEAEDSLEWRSVCLQVAEFCSTSKGRELCAAGDLPIGRDRGESQRLLDQAMAAVLFPRPLDFSGVDDISVIVASAVSGTVLSIGDLCAVERSLRAARNVYQQLMNLSSANESSNRYSPLLLLFQNCSFLADLAHRIECCIDCNLSIVRDQASEKLQSIRSDRKKNSENLDVQLKNISNRIFQSGGIDSPLITKRRSRMCVGIRASHKSLLPDGIVLGVSSSGATYFMEPREIVNLNNMEVRLSNSEQAEELAILSLLTSDIASLEREIEHLMEIILCVDLASARAYHAKWMGSSCPVFSKANADEDSFLVNIEGFSHPLLLERSLKNSGFSESVVPVDIKIRKGIRVLVISGPNTGGKTATMKSLGLASLMAKAGMFLPAKETPRLQWFDQVLVDIGDNQSLEKNLSTFSGHISRICKILKVASTESLVLVDEIGSGTDPSEGVALATCILQQLLTKAALTLVTTHYADLSLLKLEDDRFENAAMEFCLKTLQPTYRVLWGTTGKSNALTIAAAVGFDTRVIDRAREWVEKLLPDKQRERQGLLFQSLSREKDMLEVDAQKAESLLNQVKDLYHEIHVEAKDLEKRETALKSKESQKIQEEVNLVKSQLDAIILDFEQQLSSASPEQYASILRRSDAAISSIVNAHTSASDIQENSLGPPSLSPRVGDLVLVNSLGGKSAAVVDFVDQDNLLVQYGKMRVRVKRGDVRVSPAWANQEATGERKERKDQERKPFSRASSNQAERGERKGKREEEKEGEVYGAAVQTRRNTVDLRGMRAEDAGMKVAAAVAGCRSYAVLFVVHGVGTGAVKDAALSVLRTHPRVTRFEPESPVNDGCTIAYIK